jgi:hypothetical protein
MDTALRRQPSTSARSSCFRDVVKGGGIEITKTSKFVADVQVCDESGRPIVGSWGLVEHMSTWNGRIQRLFCLQNFGIGPDVENRLDGRTERDESRRAEEDRAISWGLQDI